MSNRPIEKMYRHALNAPGLSLKFRQALRDGYNKLPFLAPEIQEVEGWGKFMYIVNSEFYDPDMTHTDDELRFIDAVVDKIPLQEYPNLSMEQILTDTVKHYSENPRGVVGMSTLYGSACVYVLAGNPRCMCAVGRCCIAPLHTWTGGVRDLFDHPNRHRRLQLEDELKPQYRGYKLEFWRQLQILHDTGVYWRPKAITEIPNIGKVALSEDGAAYFNHICRLIYAWSK